MSVVLREMAAHLAKVRAETIKPCRPTPATKPPSGPGWIHEIKQDGYRMMVRRDGERVRLITKGGYNWADRYPGIVKAALAIKCPSFLLDGEVMVAAADGRAVFDQLRAGWQKKPHAALYTFDVLIVDGEDVRRHPLKERKQMLADLLRQAPPCLQRADYIDDEDGPIVFELGLPGIVSKRIGSPYRSGRSPHWVKVTNPDGPEVRRREEEDWTKSKKPARR